MCKPIELIPETTTGQDRKLISLVTEIDYIKSLIQTYDLTVPIVIKNMLKYCEIDENYVENNIDYEDLRKELLLILFYSKTVPTNVTKSNIYSTIDETFQGNRDNLVRFNLTPETIRTVTYASINSKTLEGFGGLLRKYCPKRCGPVFSEIIKNLLILPESNQTTENANIASKKDKLVALLTNKVGYSRLYINEMSNFCWQPLADVDIDLLSNIIGRKQLSKIEKENYGQDVLHCYRISNKANQHGHSNYNPCMHYKFKFTGYDDRH